MNLIVSVKIEQTDGETQHGYPKTKTLGELNVEAEATRAWSVYRDALHQLTQPDYVLVPKNAQLIGTGTHLPSPDQ